MNLTNTVQSQFSDIEFSDNLWFSDLFSIYYLDKIIQFRDIMWFTEI